MPPKRTLRHSLRPSQKKQKTAAPPPPPPPPPPAESVTSATSRPTVYDAVASRLNSGGFIVPNRVGPEWRPRSFKTVPADEFIAQRIRAPQNVAPYTMEDVQRMRMPDDDLMIALHQYAADFYCANGMGQVSSRSMDETALIAMGLLVEEMVEQILDEGGHLALVDMKALQLEKTGLVRDPDDEYYDEEEPTMEPEEDDDDIEGDEDEGFEDKDSDDDDDDFDEEEEAQDTQDDEDYS